ncbi:hhH-GPD superfamily base excision DNA repair protein [Hirsutella rhossiliensis]|uniref:Endonuclease III homolog n=1 Tax=Hirsutella rhossiliensis TaxID=111463 RepID=A0A9P8MYU6_9HYPO|nr:hhH-GPD superfamily base excision DNA repair protein [Hirsutella rhossiliensis]KAH0963805.1 hhH-GPD superfamily base excision DNA repair protein [Hirsutella rhossiliensis]
MRSSRISKDTSKLFDRVAGPASPPRRTTRSLARFALAATEPVSKLGTRPPDIEDGIGPPAKRRRRALDDSAVKSEAVEAALVAVSAPPPPSKTKGRARKPARKTTDPDTGAATVTPPSDWEAMYRAVERMRAPGGLAHGAAVDTMGCERLADKQASPREQRFHTLVALMLSSQTKDTVNAVAMHKLKTELPAHEPGAPVGLNLDNMLAVDPKLLNQLIWAVGFHNNKTKFLKQAAVILRDKWDGDIPDSIEGLTSLPGVGPKMAYLCMSAAWDVTLGIGVDVHVHRITNLWGWHKTKTPEETRLALESWLPRDRWREINWLLVGFGQEICRPVGRRCGDCDLGLEGLCKAAERKKVVAGRTMKTQVEAKVEGGGGVEVQTTETVVKEDVVNQIDAVLKTSP